MTNKITLTDAQVDQIVSDLEGTCSAHSTIGKCLEDMGFPQGVTVEDLTIESMKYIDEQVFCCGICGWWYSVDERYDEDTCCECHRYEEEDEDEC